MMPWAVLFGFVGILYLVTWTILTLTGGSFITLIGVTVAFVLVIWAALVRERFTAVKAFRKAFPGKDLLIVLTDSPHWQPYIEEKWLSRWADRAIVFNRSRPWASDQPEARLWQAVKGVREHTPLAIVIVGSGKPRVVRFFKAFRDFKHGKDAPLKAREEELTAALAHDGRPRSLVSD